MEEADFVLNKVLEHKDEVLEFICDLLDDEQYTLNLLRWGRKNYVAQPEKGNHFDYMEIEGNDIYIEYHGDADCIEIEQGRAYLRIKYRN